MKRIKKYLGGSYFRLPSLSSEFQTGASYIKNTPYINTLLQQYITNTGNFSAPIPTSSKVKDNTLKDTISNIGSSIIGKASDVVSDKIFGDSELGRNLGTIFSSGLNSVGDTVLNNAIKKAALTDGLTKNLGSSVGGAVAGLGANYLGRGITSILGNNAASRFLGLSASTVVGTIGGKILSSGTKNLFSGLGSINPIGLGMSAVGAGLSAATGPSKEYNGTYGSTTKALDTVYDALLAGINFVPGWGLIASGAMALNKGLSNIFGSTDGMTTLDAILGSAFMPAPIKWLNMLGSSKTGTFNKLSWQNTLKTSNFMQNAFGDLEDKFSKAREEAGKTYGTFSQGAKKRALNNIDFSNFAWNKILNMADLNEYQNIRSSDMASINNLRYALWILGGFSPLARGKKGMKIFNNSTNHNLGLRLLSGAALIDNKQMILSALNGTKIKKKGIKSGINVDYYDPDNVMSVVANNPNKTIVLDELTVRPYNKLPMQSELFQGMTNQTANEKADEHVNRVTPTAEDLFNIGTLGGLNNLSPALWGRRAYDTLRLLNGEMPSEDYARGWFYGNNGLVSDLYAKEHPYTSTAINLAGDIGAFGTLSALRKLPKYAALMKAENMAAQEATALNWRDMFVNSARRTRLGDVEVDNPRLYYHQSDAGKAKNFVSTGRMRTPLEEYWLAKEEAGEHIPIKLRTGIEPGYPQDPGRAMFSQGKLWYDKLNGIRVNPEKPDLLVTAKEMPIANKNASIMSDKKSLKALYGQGSRRVTNDNIYTQGPHNTQNTSAYTWEPEYGYRRVFAEETPTLNWVNTARTPRITTENTAIITPKQWATAARDAAYKEAVESGNRPEALRLLEQAYLNSGIPKTDITVTSDGHAVGWYHGSEWGNHTVFDSSAMNATIGGASANGKIKGNFLTTDVPSAIRYSGSSRYSSANIPEYTSPQTFSEKIKNLFGVYKPRRLYPAERVGGYAPKPERLFDTKGRPPIEHLDKVDRVVYPLYVNPGKNIMRLDFQGKPWSRSPVEFPNNFYLKRWIRDDKAKTYREEIIPFDNYESAFEAWKRDPINVRHGDISLSNKPFDEGIRSIEGFNSAPRYENVRLVEERIPNTTNGAVQTAVKNDNSSVLIKNVIDSNGGPGGAHYAIDDFVTLKPEQMKLADITYDDAGNLIPLSKRFNWKNPDIRYSWLPWFLGGSTAATLYNKSK